MMRFAVDRMLGRLAKWLRLLGYDAKYSNNLSGELFLALAEEGRILLTKNTWMKGKVTPDRLVFIRDNDPMVQLDEVIRLFGLKPEPRSFFTRCTLCNGLLESIQSYNAYGIVPDYVWTAHDRFSRCMDCGKIYWPGSHLERSRKEINRLLGV
jgi:uncharacterized protein with PIN domain